MRGLRNIECVAGVLVTDGEGISDQGSTSTMNFIRYEAGRHIGKGGSSTGHVLVRLGIPILCSHGRDIHRSLKSHIPAAEGLVGGHLLM